MIGFIEMRLKPNTAVLHEEEDLILCLLMIV